MKNLSVTLVRKPSRRFATPDVEAIKRIAGELIRSSDNNYNSYDDIGRVDDVYESLSRMLEEWSKTKKAPRHAAWLHDKINAESQDPS